MCRSRAEGGQRCAGHARDALQRADKELAVATGMHNRLQEADVKVPRRVAQRLYTAEAKRDDARALYASTNEGHKALTEQLAAVNDRIKTGPWEDQRLGSPLYDERIDLTVALTEGRRLRDQAARIREAVRDGSMTSDDAITAAQYPTPQTQAARRARVPKATSLNKDAAYYRSDNTRAVVGATEQAYRTKITEHMVEPLGNVFLIEATIADHARFDARVEHAATEDGETELRARLAAMSPGDKNGDLDQKTDAHEYTEMREAIKTGTRLRQTRVDAAEMVHVGLINEHEAETRCTFPIFAIRRARADHLHRLAKPQRRATLGATNAPRSSERVRS